MLRHPVCVVVLLVLTAACSHKPTAEEAAKLKSDVQRASTGKPPQALAVDNARGRQVWKEVGNLYKKNDYELVWSDGRSPRAQVDGLLNATRGVTADGLDPQDYPDIAAARQAFDKTRAVDFDLQCTYAYLRLGWDLTHGRIDPKEVAPQWHDVRRDVDVTGRLLAAAHDGHVEDGLAALAPQALPYQGLKHQLALARQRGDAAAVESIAMNMERWRWLPDDLGENYLLVNIPAFRLDAIEHGKSVLGMRVVTGKKDNPTPVLVDTMTTVVFSPYWNIPESIVQKEILPQLAAKPDYLERHNMEVDESGQHYRQRPGRGNSLGQVKFVFPNHFNVYLHGTPSQSLFDRVERDFSHGCVRLEYPLELAKYVLRDQPEWTEERIMAAMNAGVEKQLALKKPLPIYLVYFTAWEEDGALKTAPDVYGLDRRYGAAAGGL